jgi:cyanate permease
VGIVSGAVLIPATARWIWGRPEQIGQYPDGVVPERVDGALVDVDAGSWTLAQARKSRAFWLLIAATSVPALVTNGLSFSQVSIFTDRGLTPALAATTFTVESVVALPISLLAGWVADRFGSRYVLAIGNATLVVALVCLIFTESVAMAMVYAMFRAITSGTWVLGSEASWPAYFGSRYLASIAGVSYSFAFVSAALGPLPFALAYDLTGSYDAAIWGLIAIPALTTVAALLAEPPTPGKTQ